MPNLQYVYVSPLRRGIETAYNIFKNHKNFNDLQFIVDPDLREHLWATCDIPAPGIKRRFLNYRKWFHNLDTSLLDKLIAKYEPEGLEDAWFLGNTEKEFHDKLKKSIVEEFKGDHKAAMVQ